MEITPAKRRRNRAIVSCISCRRRKIKCNRSSPCKACIDRGEAHLCTTVKVENPLSRIAVPVHPNGQDTEFHISRDEEQGDPTEIFSSLGGFTAYTEAKSDGLIDNILALHKDSIAGCACAKQNERCMLHSDSTGHFLSMFVQNAESRRGKGPEHEKLARRAWLEELERNWTPRGSLLAPEITDRDKVAQLEKIERDLPSLDVLETLVKLYYDDMDWLWIVTPRELFLPTFEAFKELMLDPAVRITQIDPAFLSLLCIKCAVVCFVQNTPTQIFGYDISPEECDRITLSLYENCLSLMKIAEWVTKPSLRSIWASLHVSDFLTLYLEKDTDLQLTHTTIAYQQCFKLHFQADTFEKTRLRTPPQDPALPTTNLLLNREVRRHVLLAAYLRFWSESLSGSPVIGLGIPSIPLPINCNLSDIMQPEFERIKDLSSFNDSILQRPMHEPTDVFFDLALYYHIHAVQSVHADHRQQKHRLTAMDHLFRVEQRLVRLIIMLQGVPGLDPVTTDIDYNQAIFRFLNVRPTVTNSQRYSLTSCFYLCLSSEAIFNMHRGLFETHLRTGKHPISAIKAIQASRQILRCERVLKGNIALRNVAHLCNIQRAVVTLFMGLLLSMTDKSQPETIYLSSRDTQGVSVQGILRPDDLRGDIDLLREAAGGVESCAMLQGKLGENRASVASSTLSLLWYVVSCTESRLKEIDPQSQTNGAPTQSDSVPLMSLDELLSLSDELIATTSKDLDNMEFYSSVTKMGSDFNPNLWF